MYSCSGTQGACSVGFHFRRQVLKLMEKYADRVAADVENDGAIARVRAEITELCRAVPLYPDMY